MTPASDRRSQFILRFGPPALAVTLCLKLIYFARALECCGPYPHNRAMLSATMAGVLLVFSPAPLLRPRARLAFALAANFVLTTLALADSIHFQFFGDLMSVTELQELLQVPFVMSSVAARTHASDIVFYADVFVVLGAAVTTGTHRAEPTLTRRDAFRFASIALVVGLAMTQPSCRLMWDDPDNNFEFEVGRRQIVAAIGVVPYHLYDIGTFFRDRILQRAWVRENEKRLVRYVMDRVEEEHNVTAPLLGLARSRNLIVIQAEALQAFPLGLVVDGQPITPNLSAFAAQSIHFTEFYDQTGGGTTSDGVFTSMQSFYPIPTGAVATRYATNHFRALPAVLADAGYRTMSRIPDFGEFWNLRGLQPALGFKSSLFRPDFPKGPAFGQGLADEFFLDEAVAPLKSAEQPFMAMLITVSNHHPYDLPAEYRQLHLGSLERTMLGDYLHSVHYFDRAFGKFIRQLEENGILDESVVAVYGDHQAWLDDTPQLAQLAHHAAGDEYAAWKNRKRLVFMIRLPKASRVERIAAPAGHLDVAPTLLNLLGVGFSSTVMLGRDALSAQPPLVIFRDGSFSNGRYDLQNRPGPITECVCHDASSGATVSCDPLADERFKVIRRLTVSDTIIRADLMPTLIQERATTRRTH